ncbi:hypothetical protein N431DRAFT_492596 [Stipitochalara longipes BDJ]|nr:hypothetical protein N431DRAFT_492596 [Stipitochalara longipes BDJ]
MDSLTALSIAGTLIQFLDFALKILTTSHQLYKIPSGSLSAHEELKCVGRDFSGLAKRLNHARRSLVSELAQYEPALEDLCIRCEIVVQELTEHLGTLKTEGKKQPLKIFRASFKATWDQERLDVLVQKLQSLSKSLEEWFLVDIVDRIDPVSIRQTERFARLDDQSQMIISALLDMQTSRSTDLFEQRKAVAQMLDRLDMATSSFSKSSLAVKGSSPGELSSQSKHSKSAKNEKSTPFRALEDQLKVKQEVEISILKYLQFSTMPERLEEVSEVHQRTFKIMFEPQKDNPWSCFTSWLKTGEGIFWINGKAGSGKSTLMRYIYGHPKTRQELSGWAGPTALSMAEFTFWNSGTKEQKSQLGLLRSMLFKVLDGARDLIPVVLPWLWARCYSQALDPLTPHSPEKPLSLADLTQAFSILAHQTKIPFKLCLFIDGLDEYEGDLENTASIFEKLARAPNVKICVSSRRSLIFENSFSTFPGLKLPDLTLNDIKNYVNGRLTTSKRYQQLVAQAPVPAAALENKIVAWADGVFLWVRLVVESLLSGIGIHDEIHDLQSRLDILPTDLEKLYHHLLMNKIDPVYIDDASKMFQMLRETKDAELSILALALTDESYFEKAITSPLRPWSEGEILSVCQKMEDRMKTRCAGLIEVSGTVTEILYEPDSKANDKVQYLHRTVKDFLEHPEVHNLITSHVKKLEFDANISLLQSSLLQLKIIPKYNAQPKFWNLAREAMQYASVADLSTDSHMSLVHELGRTIKAYRKTSANFYPEKWSESFLAVAVQYNLWAYVEKQLSAPELLKQGVTVRTLLAYALGVRGFHNYDIEHNKEMVRLLLKHATKDGTNSNIFKASSIWQQVLQPLEERYLEQEFFVRQFEVVRLFLQYGADPEAICILKDGRELTADTIIREGLPKYPHPATDDILRMLDVQEALEKPKPSVIQRFSSWSSRKPKLTNTTALI